MLYGSAFLLAFDLLFCETDCGASWGAGHIPGAAGGFVWNLAEFVQWDAGGNFSQGVSVSAAVQSQGDCSLDADFVSIPLALLGFDYWALIIGTLVQQLATCIFQARYVSIPVSFRFDFASLKEMLSFSLWTLFESITIWLSTWGALFIVGSVLSSYYLGLYRGSSVLTNAAFSIITGVITPVLFAGLSRIQSDMKSFQSMYYDIEKKSILFVAPIGVGIFVFRDIAVSILLGAQWHEADFLVGLRGLVGCFSVVINSMGSEALRAKGMPRLSALSQIFYFPVMFAVLYVTAPLGFDILAIGTCLCSLELDCVKLVILNKCLGFSLRKLIGSICPAMGSAVLAGGMVHLFRSFLGTDSIIVSIISMLLFGVLYLGIVCLSRENRDFLLAIFKKWRHELVEGTLIKLNNVLISVSLSIEISRM